MSASYSLTWPSDILLGHLVAYSDTCISTQRTDPHPDFHSCVTLLVTPGKTWHHLNLPTDKMGLEDLPPDVLACVWDAVLLQPQDVSCLAVTSKYVNASGQHAMKKHKDMLEAWSVLTFAPYSRKAHLPTDVLLSLLRTPAAARYIRKVSISADDSGTAQISRSLHFADALIDIATALEHSVSTLPASCAGMQGPKTTDAILALLRYALRSVIGLRSALPIEVIAGLIIAALGPNTQTIFLNKVSECYEEIEGLFSTLQGCRRTEEDEGARNVLDKFDTLGISNSGGFEDRAWISMEALWKWPSLRTVFGWNVHIGGDDDVGTMLGNGLREVHYSQVETLCSGMTRCLDIPLEVVYLEPLLRSMPWLRRLHYSMSDTTMWNWSFAWFLHQIGNAVGKTLASLSLTVHECSIEPGEPSFTGFQRLEWLETQAKCLSSTDQPNMLVDILPKTIESMRLDVGQALDSLQDLVEGYGQKKRRALRRFKVLEIACPDAERQRMYEIVKPLRQAAVAVEWIGDVLEPLHHADHYKKMS